MFNIPIKYHKIPERITSNGKKFFIFNYWKILILLLETRLSFFISYYPNTDRQTKKTNQSFEKYL